MASQAGTAACSGTTMDYWYHWSVWRGNPHVEFPRRHERRTRGTRTTIGRGSGDNVADSKVSHSWGILVLNLLEDTKEGQRVTRTTIERDSGDNSRLKSVTLLSNFNTLLQ